MRLNIRGRIMICIACLCLAGILAAGCSMGFTALRPSESGGLYVHLFEDVITKYDDPYWLWVRGTIGGDMNGNGTIEEEVVIATIQKGTEQHPGPIELAFLVVCEVAPDGGRKAMARVLLFDANPIPGAPRPINDLGQTSDAPLTRVRAQMVQDKATLMEQVVVYFWSEHLPSDVWYVGYRLDDGQLVKNLEVAMHQQTPGFLTSNLDPSIEATPYGYQLLFSVSALPENILRKLGSPHEAPMWGHVYARDESGEYRQADWRYGEDYRKIENAWNHLYLKAVMTELPPDELAWFEYHMGLMNHYSGDAELADRFLKKAAANAKDPVLVEAVKKALEYTREPEKPWPPKKNAAAED